MRKSRREKVRKDKEGRKEISLLNITAIPFKALKIVSVTWFPPLSVWIKVNTDGSIIGSPGISGAGGVFCNSRGYVK